MAAAAILNFQKVLFRRPGDTYLAHIYQHTKSGANRSRIDRYMPFCAFSKMAVAAILDLLFLQIGPRTMSRLLGSMFSANSVMIGLNFLEMLRFHYFVILAGKCLLGVLGDFVILTPQNYEVTILTPKRMQFPQNHAF